LRTGLNLTKAQIKSLVEDYRAGKTIAHCCVKYDITRSTLYRCLRKYDDEYLKGQKTDAYYRIECQRLKDALAEAILERNELRAMLANTSNG